MATLYNKWEEAKKSNQPVENVQKLIDENLSKTGNISLNIELVAINKLRGNILKWSCDNAVNFYDNVNIWNIMDEILENSSSNVCALPKNSAENIMKATNKIFDNLQKLKNDKLMTACTLVLRNVFLERRIQYRPPFSDYCKAVGSILSNFNDSSALSHYEEIYFPCRSLIIVLLELLNNLLYEQANRKKIFSTFLNNLIHPLMALMNNEVSPNRDFEHSNNNGKRNDHKKLRSLSKQIFSNALFSSVDILSYPSAFKTMEHFIYNVNNNDDDKKKKKKKKKTKTSNTPVTYVAQLMVGMHKYGATWDTSFLYKIFLEKLSLHVEKVKSKKELSEITINFQFFIELYHTYYLLDPSKTGSYSVLGLFQQDKLLKTMLNSDDSYVYNEQDKDRPQFNILKQYCVRHIDVFKRHAESTTSAMINGDDVADSIKYEISILTTFLRINHELISHEEILLTLSLMLKCIKISKIRLESNVFNVGDSSVGEKYKTILDESVNFIIELLQIYSELRQIDVVLKMFLNVPEKYNSIEKRDSIVEDGELFSNLFLNVRFLNALSKQFALCLPAKLPSLWNILIMSYKDNAKNKSNGNNYIIVQLTSKFLYKLCSSGSIASHNSVKLSHDALDLIRYLLKEDDSTINFTENNYSVFEVLDALIFLCQRAYRYLPKEIDQFSNNNLLNKAPSVASSHLITLDICKNISSLVKPFCKIGISLSNKQCYILLKLLLRLISIYHSAKEDYNVAINDITVEGDKSKSHIEKHTYCIEELNKLSNVVIEMHLAVCDNDILSSVIFSGSVDDIVTGNKLVFDNIFLLSKYCDHDYMNRFAKFWLQLFITYISNKDTLSIIESHTSFIAANVFESNSLRNCIMNELYKQMDTRIKIMESSGGKRQKKRRKMTKHNESKNNDDPSYASLLILFNSMPTEYISMELAPNFLHFFINSLANGSLNDGDFQVSTLNAICKLLSIMKTEELVKIPLHEIKTLLYLPTTAKVAARGENNNMTWLAILTNRLLNSIIIADDILLQEKTESKYIAICNILCTTTTTNNLISSGKYENLEIFFNCTNEVLLQKFLTHVMNYDEAEQEMMDGDEDANDEEVPPPLENIMFEMDDDKDMKKTQDLYIRIVQIVINAIQLLDRLMYNLNLNDIDYHDSNVYKLLSPILDYYEIITRCEKYFEKHKGFKVYEPKSLSAVPSALKHVLKNNNNPNGGNRFVKNFLIRVTNSMLRFKGVDSNLFVSIFQKCLSISNNTTGNIVCVDVLFLEEAVQNISVNCIKDDGGYTFDRILNILLDSILNDNVASVSFKALEVFIEYCEEEWKYIVIANHLPTIIRNIGIYVDKKITNVTSYNNDDEQHPGKNSENNYNSSNYDEIFNILIILCQRNKKILISSSACTCILYILSKNISSWATDDNTKVDKGENIHVKFVKYMKSMYKLLMTLFQSRSRALYQCAGHIVSLLNATIHEIFIVFNRKDSSNQIVVDSIDSNDDENVSSKQLYTEHFFASMRYLRRIYEEIANHATVFRHFVPYLLSSVFKEMKSYGITMWTSDVDLKEGLYFLFNICTEHETRQIYAREDNVGRSFFTKFFDDYKKSKYSGIV